MRPSPTTPGTTCSTTSGRRGGRYTLREQLLHPSPRDWRCSYPAALAGGPFGCGHGPIDAAAEPYARGRDFGNWFPARLDRAQGALPTGRSRPLRPAGERRRCSSPPPVTARRGPSRWTRGATRSRRSPSRRPMRPRTPRRPSASGRRGAAGRRPARASGRCSCWPGITSSARSATCTRSAGEGAGDRDRQGRAGDGAGRCHAALRPLRREHRRGAVPRVCGPGRRPALRRRAQAAGQERARRRRGRHARDAGPRRHLALRLLAHDPGAGRELRRAPRDQHGDGDVSVAGRDGRGQQHDRHDHDLPGASARAREPPARRPADRRWTRCSRRSDPPRRRPACPARPPSRRSARACGGARS